MGGPTFSREKFNAREIILSGDAVRAERLAARDIQDELSFLGAAQNNVRFYATGSPFAGMSEVPLLLGNVGAFTMAIGAGRGYQYDPAFAGLDADDSPYLVLRWPAQTITGFVPPDATNGRIDLIVATPAMVDTDLQSRRILVDPASRTVTPQNVFKTSNPLSTLSIVTGVPSSAPVAPAVPVGTAALYEVFVPATAPDANTFEAVPRLWRKAMFPGSILNGPQFGCVLNWGAGAGFTDSNGMSFNGFLRNACWIDGELIELSGIGSPALFQDTLANPFATPAPINSARPYFVYLCGGRNLPQGAKGYISAPFTTRNGNFLGAVLVESTTVPGVDGHPTSPIQTPRGPTQLGAVQVGLCFVLANTTLRARCMMDDEMVIAAGTLERISAPGSTNILFASAPPLGGLRRQTMQGNIAMTATGSGVLGVNPAEIGLPPDEQSAQQTFFGGNADIVGGTFRVRDGANVPGISIRIANGTLASVAVNVNGYSHNVKRLQHS